MKVLSLIYKTEKNAGPKATSDVDKILQKEYNAEIIKLYRVGNFRIRTLLTFVKYMFSKDILVLQMPMILKAKAYKILPKKRTILLIHDINGLRHQDKEILDKELNIYKQFRYIIVHNDVMKQFLVENGIDESTIFVLELFDYLVDKTNTSDNKDVAEFVYTGNLLKEKSPFLYQFKDGELKYHINAYGLNAEDSLNKMISYKGSFESEDLSKIEGKIGIVWDGNKDEQDESDEYKNYTKYNNPHKLSCYMACGLPVAVWRKAATSSFVEKNNIGYLIDTLDDINNIDFSTYDEKKKNVEIIQKKVINGEYTKTVFGKVLEKIDEL